MRGSFATSGVPGTRFRDVRWVEHTGSTNADLLAEARTGAPEGVVLVADHQGAGRGRLDRTWSAPPGSSLLVSVLLRPTLAAEDLFLVTQAAGLAAIEACAGVAGVEPGLKWPNDLVHPSAHGIRKLAGILAESVVEHGKVTALVVGMGLNVNWPEPLSGELASTAVALSGIVSRPIDREELLVAWLGGFDRRLSDLDSGDGRRRLLDEVRSRSVTLGQRVRIEQSGQTLRGTAIAITDAGHLVVEPAEGGEPVEISVGDVIHARLEDTSGS